MVKELLKDKLFKRIWIRFVSKTFHCIDGLISQKAWWKENTQGGWLESNLGNKEKASEEIMKTKNK